MKNLFSKALIVALVSATILTSCDDESDASSQRVRTFVGGSISEGRSTSRFLAEDTIITVDTELSATLAVTTSGSDVYELYTTDEQGFFGVLKNGVVIEFDGSDNLISPSDIAVANGNVYITDAIINSNGDLVAALWTNGVKIALSAYPSYANDLTVVGNDVYAAGGEGPAAGEAYSPVYWKNGVMTVLSDAGNHPDYDGGCLDCDLIGSRFTGEATGIAVEGNNVYVSGYSNNSGGTILWKNNVSEWVGNIEAFVSDKSIAVSNGIVYLAGTQGDGNQNTAEIGGQAVVFENGVAINIDANRASQVSVVDGSVYVLTRTAVGGSNTRDSEQVFSIVKDGATFFELPTGHDATCLHAAKF